MTELLAENDGGLRDADGDSPDWIELSNDGASAMNLAGWHLTDSPDHLSKWTFPATNLESGRLLVIFASGKDRAVAGGELHTNFRLEQNGGYLALVEPDGATIVQALTYPKQRVNVSFGFGRQVASTLLLAAGASARVYVPSNGALGLAWTARAFDDSGWLVTNTPLAYNLGGVASPLLSIDFNVRGQDPTGTTQPGFQSFIINSNISTVTIQTQATTRVYGGLSVSVSNSAPNGYDDRLRTPNPPNSGAFTESLLLRDFVFSRDLNGSGGLDVTVAGLGPGKLHRVTVWSFDSGSAGTRVSDWFANGVTVTNNYTFNGQALPTSNAQYRFTFDSTSDASGRIAISGRRDASSVDGAGVASFGVYLNAVQVSTLDFTEPGTGLAGLMFGHNATALVRVPFEVAVPASITALTLRLGYNDGFAAWLNGQLVAARNAPATLDWNSNATGVHSGTPEDILIVVPPGLLTQGVNLLAIQGLNLLADDPDFSLAPELFAQQISPLPDRFFQPPTPGTNNPQGYVGLVADTKFSHNRGFYDGPISLTITTATEGAEIRFTTNGSIPTPLNGTVFSAPIGIAGQSFVRAAAFKTGLVPSEVDTHSYFFLRDVLRQSNNLPGYPTTWQAGYPADYAMDPALVSHPFYGANLSNDLRSLRTLAIVSDQNGLWNSSTGIYPNSASIGAAWERATSVELLAPDGQTEFATTCKVQVHGNASRDNVRTPKHSLGLAFNSDYGPAKLRHDWFGGGVTVHDKIVLRSCGFVDGWAGRYADDGLYTSTETGETFRGLRYRPENTCYLRDVWVKESFRAMGWDASRSEYVHLYLNGLYWGLYQPSEHVDASFYSLLHGGPEGAWDVLVGEDNNGPPVVVDGSVNDWQTVLNLANAGVTSEAAFQRIADLVELDNLIDYMIVHIVAESEDWPRHNWYLAHRRATNGIPATKFTCTVWDQELTLDRLVRRNRIEVGTTGGEVYSPARVYAQLRAWPEFRRRFGDRVQKHLFNDGALVPTNNVDRLLAQAALVRRGLIGESARWGDARKGPTPGNVNGTGKTFTRDEWWQPEIDKLATNFFRTLTATNIARFRAVALYPALNAPVFSTFGGGVPAEFALALYHTNAAGTVYYTTDGTDPRQDGTGAVDVGAQAYTTPIGINMPTIVRARVLNGTVWSALVEATFYPPQDLSGLALTELMYNPPNVGSTNGDEFEFIELKNTGSSALNLSGLRFNGVAFSFTNGTVLGPGAFFVLARNPAAFAAKYPGVVIHGLFSGALNNGGESLTLTHPLGSRVLSVSYDDEAPWPVAADGYGFSLVQNAPGLSQAPEDGHAWRASTARGGSPGADDPAPVIPSVVINEVLTHSDPVPPPDTIELFNPTASEVDLSGWFLTDDRTAPKKFRIPDGTRLAAGGYLTFDETQFNMSPGTDGSFSLSSHGESVYLFSGDAATNLTGYSHGFNFDAAPAGVTFGRYLNSVGDESFPLQRSLSFRAANSGPRVGPVILNEIHYHPAPGLDEFIELQNIAATNVPLYAPGEPTNTWRLDGLGYTFPPQLTLLPGQYLLLVPVEPAFFRTRYDVPAEALVVGPYSGGLQDSGERLKLERPDVADTNGAGYIVVDELRYNDKAPWPAAADGSGPSLQRLDPNAYGNDPLQWRAAGPTPGRPSSAADTDGDGMPDEWEISHHTEPLIPDAEVDPDGDGSSNLQEYLAGTDPQDPESRFKVDSITLSNGRVILQFTALANRSYAVLGRETLDPGPWQTVASFSSAPQTSVRKVTNDVAGHSRFYKLSVAP
jgi:hypothetical protein